MRSIAEFSISRLTTTLIVAVLGGVQIGLYMADRYDDGVAEALSFGWLLRFCSLLSLLPFNRLGDHEGIDQREQA